MALSSVFPSAFISHTSNSLPGTIQTAGQICVLYNQASVRYINTTLQSQSSASPVNYCKLRPQSKTLKSHRL